MLLFVGSALSPKCLTNRGSVSDGIVKREDEEGPDCLRLGLGVLKKSDDSDIERSIPSHTKRQVVSRLPLKSVW